ncbi:MAG: N-acetylmuramoyl-L-alanine amidase [Thermovibrio sp.]|nr:MAG: N-acetylmuramoyl-L-alanine amidase [Thermovibrio sp.]
MNRRELLKVLLLGSALELLTEAASARIRRTVIYSVRYSSNGERTRIVLDCSREIPKRRIREKLKGKELWLEIEGAGAVRRLKKKLKSPLVREVTVYPINGRRTKVRITLRNYHRFKIFGLKPCRGKPFRIVVDVFPEFIPISCKVRRVPKRVVVLDPGHGGKDPGAVWPVKSKYPTIEEKRITLSIAFKVRKLLSKKSDIKVVMTRTRDVYVPLLKRAEIAAKECADAFVSIHADSMPRYPQWNGVTVFKASPHLFAKAERTAMAVARKIRICNDVMCWSITPTLINLSTTVTFAESSKLAEAIVRDLKARVNDDLVNGIRDMQRNIVVLKTPGRPAVLIESGFLTNPLDRKRLLRSSYQWEIAKGIAKGIEDYLYSLNNVALVEG